jgi:sporulation protein YlmC with PRC-barrel domain
MRNEYCSGSGVGNESQSFPPAPALLSASKINGNDVYGQKGERLGCIREIMLDMHTGKMCYVVLSFDAFLSAGEKLFAVPWGVMALDAASERLLLAVELERLRNAPGFSQDQWPDMADSSWADRIHSYYRGQSPPKRATTGFLGKWARP